MATRPSRLLCLLPCLFLAALTFAGDPPKRHWLPGNTTATAIKAEPVQATGLPVLLKVVLTNKTGKATSFWTPWIPYPPFSNVPAVISRLHGQNRSEYLYNYPGSGISGSGKMLAAGQSIEVPAALPPLPAGSYRIRVNDSKPAQVTIKDDAKLARREAEELVRRAVAGDVFAKAVVEKFPNHDIRDLLISKDLESKNPARVQEAARLLYQMDKLPKDVVPRILRLVHQELEQVKNGQSRAAPLAIVLPAIGTDEALHEYLDWLHLGAFDWTDVMRLGQFKQPAATAELRRLLHSPRLRIRVGAARTLAPRHDPAALPVLLDVAAGNSTWARFALKELKHYPHSPEALRVLKGALESTDPEIRSSARWAFDEFQRKAGRPKSRPAYADWYSGCRGPGLLAQRRDVQADLGLTAQQKQQIETLESKVGKTHSDWLRADNPNDPVKTMSAEEQRLFDLLQQGLGKILTPAQQRRLWQINLQFQEPQCFTFPRVQKHLQLTTAQQQAINKILHQEQQDMTQVFRTTARQPVGDAQQKLQAMRQRTENQVLQVLTEPQRQAWRGLVGKPFGKPQR